MRAREVYTRRHVHRWVLVPSRYGIDAVLRRRCADCAVEQTALMDHTVPGAHSRDLWPILDLPWS